MKGRAMITYKVSSPDEGELVTADWDAAVDMALFWQCDTITELLNGATHAHLDLPRDKWRRDAVGTAARLRRIALALRNIEGAVQEHIETFEKLSQEIAALVAPEKDE